MTDITRLSIAELQRLLKSREITVVDIVKAYLVNLETNKNLNAFITVTAQQALEEAEKSDARLARGEGGKLEGVTLGIKDNFCTSGVTTTAASRILDGFIPGYTSTVVENLSREGTIMLGKTNLDEFAMGSATTSSYFGSTINPWSPAGKQLVPGGSSGGSAAAVASRSCIAALGTDTGGSIRQPAAFSGLVGFKPTYGLCSRYGIIAFASSLDQAGVLAHSVLDAAIISEVMCGYDHRDSTSLNRAVPAFTQVVCGSVKGLKIGIPREYKSDAMDPNVEEMWQQGKRWLEEAGATIVDISLPHTKYALPTYYVIAPAEASSNLARYDGVRYGLRVSRPGQQVSDMIKESREAGFGPEVKRRIMIGMHVLSAASYGAYYVQGQKVRRLIANDFENAWQQVDCILAPTAPTAAFGVDEKLDPINMYLNDVFTVPASLAGLPALSVPSGYNAEGLPLGLQVIGKLCDDEMVFRVAAVLEKNANFRGL